MQKNEFYRLKAQELYNKLQQVKTFIDNHNLTIGTFAEHTLKDFLMSSLPAKVKIAQGFIYENNVLSRQCDIILYDSLNYSPIFSSGDLVVVPAKSVFAVIEVKSSITQQTFEKTLKDFELLHSIGVHNKYLFLFNACRVKAIERYFFPTNKQPLEKEQIITVGGACKYDYDNWETLPDAIIGLNRGYYLKKSYVDFDRDMMGYVSLIIKDKSNREISCLREFIEVLNGLCSVDNNEELDDDISKFSSFEGIALFDM